MQKPFVLFLVVLLLACGKKVVPVAEQKEELNTSYSEDLAEFRGFLDVENKAEISEKRAEPIITTEPMYVNEKVDALLARQTEKNKAIKYANGYRIQLYVGRDRQLADQAKVYIYQNYPAINPYLTYSLPMYKLKVGDFLTKPDAERVLNQLKDLYPEAIIIPEKIDVKKSFLKE